MQAKLNRLIRLDRFSGMLAAARGQGARILEIVKDDEGVEFVAVFLCTRMDDKRWRWLNDTATPFAAPT